MLSAPQMEALDFPQYIDSIEDLSGGRLQIELYPIGALVPGNEVFASVQNGAIELGLSDANYTLELIPEGIALTLPFTCRTTEDLFQVWYYGGLKEIIEAAHERAGVIDIGHFAEAPFPWICTKPVTSPSDIEGLKIRTAGIRAKWFDELGAATTYIPGGEVYTALSLGTIDGATWGGANSFHSWKWYEVAKYLIFPGVNMRCNSNNVICSPDAWHSLPDDLKAILKYATELYTDRMIQLETRENQKSLDIMVNEGGLNVYYMPDEYYPEMTAAAERVWAEQFEEYKDDPLTMEALTIMIDFLRSKGYTDFQP
jgi:TRAP-type C4-dicarboxylate transport system substrate-binding protein